jgi:2-methylcitrate dehydratase PrpD
VTTLAEDLVTAILGGYDADAVIPRARRALFDHLACLHAGRRAAPVGLGDAGAAAMLDRDDVHWPSLTHPGATVWTILRTLGHERHWLAAYAGYELTARLGTALGLEHRRYWHVTTTAGTVGGALAAAVALDEDPVNAVGHALSVAGGSIVAIADRTGSRLVHRDHTVTTALACARAAAVPATPDALEHERGFLAAFGGSADGLLDPRPPAIAEAHQRRHAATGFAHAAIDAAAELAPVEDPEHVVVEVPAGAVALAGDPDPRTRETAWWSCQHAVAATLLGLDLEDPACVDEPRLREVLPRVELRTADVSRVTVDGRSAERAVPDPATDGDLVAKWTTLNPGVETPEDLLT